MRTFVLAVVILVITATAAVSVPITYTFSGKVSGSVGGSPFVDESVTINAVGDTTTVTNGSIHCNNVTSVTVVGGATVPLIGTFSVFDNTVFGNVGIRTGVCGGPGDDWFRVFNTQFNSYNLATAIGPLTVTPTYTDTVHSMNSTMGSVFLTGQNLTTFQATGPGVQLTSFLPVVGSTAGNPPSFFKTSVQLYNPKDVTISGKFVYHPAGASGSSSDPSMTYSLAPGKTVTYGDLLPAMGVASGIGTADIVGDLNSPLPVSLVRVFNDAGAAGTTGLTEEQFKAEDALQAGDVGVLLAPIDVTRFRLNIGVRTLSAGASVTFTVRDKDGNVVKTVNPPSYASTFFTQKGSSDIFDGYVLKGGETISVAINSGSAIVYGSTTDNTTQDPSVQFARKVQ